MTLSAEARTLWATALDLGRENARVSPAGRSIPPLWFLTDPERTPEPWGAAARLPAGAGVILRHFGRPEALEWAGRLRTATAGAGVVFLIAADPDLAEAVGADGVHLPERMIDRAARLRARRPDRLISAACHDARALADAAASGVDFAMLSPVFVPGGRSSGAPLGPDGVAKLAATTRLPVVALGGLTAGNVGTLRGTGASGIAGVDAIRRAFGSD